VSEAPFVVALPKGHTLGQKTTLELPDLAGETVLLLDDGVRAGAALTRRG
jgi:hypothetical protein